MKLKQYFISLYFIGMMVGISSCYEMDVFPQDQLGPSNFWQTEKDINMGIAGVYSKMKGGYMDWNCYWLEGLTDNGYCQHESQKTFLNMQTGILEATTGGPVSGIYSGSYSGIAACNNFLKNFQKAKSNAKLSEEKANAYEAEIRFLRAFCYFNLVSHYGDVPLYKEAIESVEKSKVKQSPASEVYGFISEDIDFAITYLSDDTYGSGHAVKTSALGLKARVALFQNDWNTVEAATKQIISSRKYRLSDSYESVFIKREGQKNNPEMIFSINYLNPDYRHDAEMQFYYWNALSPTTDLIGEYDVDKDKRFKSWYVHAGVGEKSWTNPMGEAVQTEQTTKTGWILLKHFDKNNKGIYANSAYDFKTDNNTVIIRYTDIYLMYIEAMVEKNGGQTSDIDAMNYMNEIRNRAGLDALTGITRKDLRSERRKELAFEGLRYFDLVRWKIAEDVMGSLVTPAGKCIFASHMYTWPFPQSEMDINPQLDQKIDY